MGRHHGKYDRLARQAGSEKSDLNSMERSFFFGDPNGEKSEIVDPLKKTHRLQ